MQKESEELIAALRELGRALKQQREPLPLLLNYERAAKVLGVGLTKLKGLIRTGDIIPTDLGGRKMVSLSELQRVAVPRATVASFSAPAPKKTRRALRSFDMEAELKKMKRR